LGSAAAEVCGLHPLLTIIDRAYGLSGKAHQERVEALRIGATLPGLFRSMSAGAAPQLRNDE